MKHFLAVYLGGGKQQESWKALSEDERKAKEKEGMEAWSKWATDNQAAIVEMGAPLGKTKAISANGIADIRNEMGAYTIVQAETHEDAAKLFLNHPHFMIFPGDRIEVMECLPMPKM